MAWYDSYPEYLRTSLFQSARAMEMDKAGGKCRRCGGAGDGSSSQAEERRF